MVITQLIALQTIQISCRSSRCIPRELQCGVVFGMNEWLVHFFFDTTVTEQNYLPMLKGHFYLQSRRLANRDSFMFMPDGASARYADDVRKWLKQKFPRRWIGRWRLVGESARSSNVSPMDFVLWRYLKNTAYKNKPQKCIGSHAVNCVSFSNTRFGSLQDGLWVSPWKTQMLF